MKKLKLQEKYNKIYFFRDEAKRKFCTIFNTTQKNLSRKKNFNVEKN